MVIRREVGIRQLKNEASKIVGEVRERGVEYVVTYRGQPVAELLPISGVESEEERRERIVASLEELWRMARVVSELAGDESAESVVSGQRRSPGQPCR